MYCKDCKYKEEVKHHVRSGYICSNDKAIDEDYGQEDMTAMLIYPYQEGGSFYVGPKFGCVHFEQGG